MKKSFKEIYLSFYEKIKGFFLPLLLVTFILNISLKDQLKLLSRFVFIAVFLLNFIYFSLEKKRSESLLFGVLLILYLLIIYLYP